MQSEFHSSVKDIVSVAVEIANEKHLRKLNQNDSLSKIVHAMCTEFNVSKDSGMYALQLMEQDAGNNKYVTEQNRGEIKNGSILRLVLSPSEIVKQIIVRLGPTTSDIDGELWALSKLSTLSADPVFAKAFLAKDGDKLIMKMILDVSESYTNIMYCLRSFIWLMRHRLVPPIEDGFVKRLIDFVSGEQHLPEKLIECCLVILEKAVRKKECTMMAGIGIPDLIQHLWNRDSPSIQVKALALINALAQGPDSTKILGSMVSKQTRDTIQNDILCSCVSPSMAHELYVYQTLILGLLEDSITSTIDPLGTDTKYITELNNIIASTNEDTQNMNGSIVSLNEERDAVTRMDKDLLDVKYKKPFVNEDFVCSTPQLVKASKKASYTRSKSTPVPSSDTSKLHKRHSLMIDFSSNPSVLICRLTLDCMLYFARRYHRKFMRVVLEEEALSRSFPSTCERLVRLLCELLGVGKPPKRDGMLYQPMVFTTANDCPFMEELFCHAALLMGTTRREMRARTPSDQEKVMCVLQRQLQEALALQPITLEQLDEDFRRFPYSVIAEIWQLEHEKNEKWQLTHLPPILQLKEQRSGAILELIQQQRINTLLRGAKFPKYTARGQRVKKKSWFVCLSTNQRAFHYGDCDDKDKLMLDCSSKILVCNIRMLVTGKKCPHVRDVRNRKSDQYTADLAFSVILDEEPHSLDFVAPNQQAFDYWTDGINCLLGNSMTSTTKEAEFKTLLNLEVRLELLDTEGILLPSKPPPVPSDPPNYNFHYDK